MEIMLFFGKVDHSSNSYGMNTSKKIGENKILKC